jgi:hypothetical protein
LSEDTVPDEDDDGTDEIVFELSDWNETDRALLHDKLTAGGIAHEWEDGDLVVDEVDADAAEDAIEAVEYPDQLPVEAAGEAAEPTDGAAAPENEAHYELMSALFVAADRLQHDPEDPVVGGEFDAAAEGVEDTAPPYGVDAQVWQQVRELAANVSDQLDEADADVIARDAATLRQLLSRLV